MSIARNSARARYVLALLSGTMLSGAPALAQDKDEIIVTATKTEQNLQDVPISVQALGEGKLDELQVSDFVDFARYLPSVSYQTLGPGYATIYMRGIASGENSNHSASLPSVGVYLDEQPLTTITGPIEPHVYDIQRVEVLMGPQGTLYGASSQSGTIKYVSNRPDPSGFEGGVGLELNYYDEGDFGGVAEGFVNVPLSDNAAVRLVGWYRRDGGYFDNEFGSVVYPTSSALAGMPIGEDNADLAEDNFNNADTYGGRALLKIDLNENWSIMPGVMGQVQDAHGFYGFDPKVGDLDVVRFNPDNNKDSWIQASLTVEGKIGIFDVVYAGAYMNRDIVGEADYSDYSYFYDAIYGYYIYDNYYNIINPSQFIQYEDRFSKISQELRFISPQDARIRFTGGLFYQRQTHNIEQNYIVRDLLDLWAISTKPDNIWLTKQFRVDRDYAAFGELSFDLTDRLTATGGARVYHYNNTLVGFFGYGLAFSDFDGSPPGENFCFAPSDLEGAPCTDLDKGTKDTDFVHKLNLAWKATDDLLLYATWSKGFRPGGINRRGTLPPYGPDFLDNYEVGWKATFGDGAVTFNGAVYYQEWTNIQFSFLGQNGLTEIRNAGNAEVFGAEAELHIVPNENFSFTFVGAYNDAELTEDYCVIANPDFDCTFQPPGTPPPFNDTLAPKGTRLPIVPVFKGSFIARYEKEFGTLDFFTQAAVNYQTKVRSDLRVDIADLLGDMPAFGTLDLSAGVGCNGWTVAAYIDNVFDERGQVHRFTQCLETTCGDPGMVTTVGGRVYVVPIKPRLIGLKFTKEF